MERWKKNFSLIIFFSETIAPRRTGTGSVERARGALYAHIFCHLEEPDRGRLKGSSHPLRPYFLRTDRTNRSRFITGTKEKKFSLIIFFSETIAPRRTGPGSFGRAHCALYAHIFCVQIGPIGAALLQFKESKGKKHLYLTISFSETIARTRTEPGS
ncbi:LOW QUALITY PROTEIN: hypothetical protein V1477_006442 [Vespula maculifrons]|uniref:Uncharacterized protein n=1 Tax=Vespula maculifrons TaxID=7453 RepID=A0ABD2CJR2_VESMC